MLFFMVGGRAQAHETLLGSSRPVSISFIDSAVVLMTRIMVSLNHHQLIRNDLNVSNGLTPLNHLPDLDSGAF
jgi:hypothetical protein